MSNFVCEVVPLKVEPHPNADRLGIVRVFDAFTVVVNLEDWAGHEKAVFIPPDSVLPDLPVYAWLRGSLRIKARVFRGIMSQGLLVPAPEGTNIGDNVAEILQISHYEPPIDGIMGNNEADPPFAGPTYDIESWFKYRNILAPGLEVFISEKIHGTNSRFTFQNGRMWCGSKNSYREQDYRCYYWNALKSNPWIEAYCRLNPNVVIYGEVFGWIQSLRYGATPSTPPMFRMFDHFENGKFAEWNDQLIDSGSTRIVPVLYHGPYSHDIVEKFIDGNSTIPGAHHIREGVVIRPKKELWNDRIGRVILKAVSPAYLSKI